MHFGDSPIWRHTITSPAGRSTVTLNECVLLCCCGYRLVLIATKRKPPISIVPYFATCPNCVSKQDMFRGFLGCLLWVFAVEPLKAGEALGAGSKSGLASCRLLKEITTPPPAPFLQPHIDDQLHVENDNSLSPPAAAAAIPRGAAATSAALQPQKPTNWVIDG